MVKLDVPRVAQTKDMSCWNASAQMLWYYSQGKTQRAGPMNSLGKIFEDNKGLTIPGFIKLAKSVGLMALPDEDSFTSQKLEALLRTYGPIWCAGDWFGFGHIVVLTGVDGGTIYFNDPDQGKAKEGTLAWFNEKLWKVKSRMMVKDPARY